MRRALVILWTFLLLCGAAHAADAIRIGVVNEITGPQAEGGRFTINGIQLALDEINKAGGLLGKPVELRIEDNASTNPGTVLAFSKLLSEGGLAGIIGPIRSTQIQAVAPTIAKAGIPTMIGGSEPSLTRVNNRWVFRARPNDSYSTRVMADFGVNTLKFRKWAIIHSTDAFGTGGKAALTDALKALGVEPLMTQGYTNNSQDFTPIVLAIKKSGAEVIGTYMTNSPDQGIFARQLRQLGVNVAWIGSPTTISITALNLAGEALYGSYAITDFTVDMNDTTRNFAKKYRERYNLTPDTFSAWAYDAMHLLATAIRNARSTDPEAVRKALLAIKGYDGVEGGYQFDQFGDGLHGYSVVRNDKGRIVFIKRVEFPPQ
ncbi:MAG: ABC transporter substrate-binding protein [Burkholderiales bacterium]